MHEEPTTNRPVLLTFICILGWVYIAIGLFTFLMMPATKTELIKTYGETYPYVTIITDVIVFIGLIGIFKMRIWGIFLVGFMFIIDVTYTYIHATASVWEYLPFIIIILSSLLYLRRMR